MLVKCFALLDKNLALTRWRHKSTARKKALHKSSGLSALTLSKILCLKIKTTKTGAKYCQHWCTPNRYVMKIKSPVPALKNYSLSGLPKYISVYLPHYRDINCSEHLFLQGFNHRWKKWEKNETRVTIKIWWNWFDFYIQIQIMAKFQNYIHERRWKVLLIPKKPEKIIQRRFFCRSTKHFFSICWSTGCSPSPFSCICSNTTAGWCRNVQILCMDPGNS